MRRCECKLVMDRLGPLSVGVIVSAVLSSLFSADQNIVAAAFVLLSPREGAAFVVPDMSFPRKTRASSCLVQPSNWNAVSSMKTGDWSLILSKYGIFLKKEELPSKIES